MHRHVNHESDFISLNNKEQYRVERIPVSMALFVPSRNNIFGFGSMPSPHTPSIILHWASSARSMITCGLLWRTLRRLDFWERDETMKAEKSLSFACSSPSGQTEELTHMYHFIKLHRPEIDYSASANEAVRGKDRGEGEEGEEVEAEVEQEEEGGKHGEACRHYGVTQKKGTLPWRDLFFSPLLPDPPPPPHTHTSVRTNTPTHTLSLNQTHPHSLSPIHTHIRGHPYSSYSPAPPLSP